jgi:pimeloyl-ACP methyl ester carboxylesterase
MKTKCRSILAAALMIQALPSLAAAADWESVLQQTLGSESSQTRRDGVRQVDATTVKGLRALWKVLAIRDPNKVDWYVREGAYEALLEAKGEEADKEIDRVLKGAEDELAREAIVYAIVWKIRKEVIKELGENKDRQIEEVKYQLRKKRGVEYFAMVMPVIHLFDPQKKFLARVQVALNDKSTRVRRAAITGMIAYPDETSIPLLLENLKKIEKQKPALYREWVLNRSALETITGEYFREKVEDWVKWWDIQKDKFSLAKRVEEESEAAKDEKPKTQGQTKVMKKDGVEVKVQMKVAGQADGYPLVVLPIEDHEVDYLRPYFHGVEEFCRVYYIRMPQIDDFLGLARDSKSNLPTYPSELLAGAVADLMEETGLKKYGLLADGPDAGHIAMSLAANAPGRVTHLVLINPRYSGESYGEAMQNVRRTGLKMSNNEIVKGIDSISLMQDGNPKYKASDAAEGEGMGRALYNLGFADPTEPEVGALNYFYKIPRTTQVMNDQKWSAKSIFAGKRIAFQTFIFVGEKDPWTPISDVTRITGVLKSSSLIKFPGASGTPYLSDTFAFTNHMEKIFRGAKGAKKGAKGGKEGEERKGEKTKVSKGAKDGDESETSKAGK